VETQEKQMFEVLVVRKPEGPEDNHAVLSYVVLAATAEAAGPRWASTPSCRS
jgi:hypothetical protein